MEKLHFEAPSDHFNALRALWEEWYVQGRDAGLTFDALVAIDLAQANVGLATTPDQRGTALNNLGNALATLGQRDSDPKRLKEAVTAYRDALKEQTREKVPLDWAMTQNNLGTALQTLGQRDSNPKRLEEAVTAYRDALEERTLDKVPLDWAGTQNNLAALEMAIFAIESDQAHLAHALAYMEQAREVFVEADATHFIDMVDASIALIKSYQP